MTEVDQTIRHSVVVQLEPAAAFHLFAEQLHRWWPREYTWGQGALETIGIEPRVDGLCFERGPHGFRCDWGRVLAWEPPRHVAFTWQIGPRREPVPDPSRASVVELHFAPSGTGATEVSLEHRDFARHGPEADAYRSALASPEGWPYILARFAAAAHSAPALPPTARPSAATA